MTKQYIEFTDRARRPAVRQLNDYIKDNQDKHVNVIGYCVRGTTKFTSILVEVTDIASEIQKV